MWAALYRFPVNLTSAVSSAIAFVDPQRVASQDANLTERIRCQDFKTLQRLIGPAKSSESTDYLARFYKQTSFEGSFPKWMSTCSRS